MGERLEYVREPLNTQDMYTVTITKHDVVIGHVPCNTYIHPLLYFLKERVTWKNNFSDSCLKRLIK